MKLIKLLFVSTFMLFATIAYAEPAVIETFDAYRACWDDNGDQVMTDTVRKVVFTNDDEGTVNISIWGICENSSSTAVNYDSETFDTLVVCDAGGGVVVWHWKYHMRPDGRYHTKCSSHPLDD